RSLEASDFTPLGEQREHPRLVQCQECGLMFASPRDPAEALAEKYRTLDVTAYLSEAESRRTTCEADAALLRRYVPSGRVLDVGCSAGLFLSCLPPQFERHGIEPGEQGAGHASQLLAQAIIHNGTVESLDFPPDHFGAVTMWD